MTNLTEAISAHGGVLSVWDDSEAQNTLSHFDVTDAWIEFPPPDPLQRNGRYFGYNESNEIGAYMSITTWRIECRDPLANYLRTVDEFADGHLRQCASVWTQWNEEAAGTTAIVAFPIGHQIDDIIAQVEYRWSRSMILDLESLQIISTVGPIRAIGSTIHSNSPFRDL